MNLQDYNKLSPSEKERLSDKDRPFIVRAKPAIVTWGLFFLISFIFVKACDSCGSESSTSANKVIDKDMVAIFAEDAAKKAVKEKLLSPKSADFSNIKIWTFEDSTAVVKGIVEAKNAYGVEITNKFLVRLKWFQSYDKMSNWIALEVSFE